MILDATASNRSMWMEKENKNIIYIDIERKLERKPTVFADNTQTPFLDGAFHTIFFDPPHGWGHFNFYDTPDYKSFQQKWGHLNMNSRYPRYYGWDKIKGHSHLVAYIHNAIKEFQRILKNDGILWFKWNESKVPLRKILSIFHDWIIMMKIAVRSPMQRGKSKTYWIMLMKKP